MRFSKAIGVTFLGSSLLATAVFFQNCTGSFATFDDGTISPVFSSDLFSSDASNSEIIQNMTTSDHQVQVLKSRGCMFDGLLYPASADFEDSVQMLKRSNCVYLQRVIETWADPPNFSEIEAKLKRVSMMTGKSYIFGMFIAEALSTNAIYLDDRGQRFDFASMCEPGTLNQWGANTCVPNSENPEYRKYIKFIVTKAFRLGVRDLVFGQLGHLDRRQKIGPLLSEIRGLAAAQGLSIAIGGQPNGIMPAAYLRQFDYVITPAYVDVDTSEKCIKGTACQAIYFHPDLINLAHHVITEIDWSSLDDDIHRLGRKSPEDRRRAIYDIWTSMRARGAGFVLPFRILYDGGAAGACEGINNWVYSASQSFACQDESYWNAILLGKNPFSSIVKLPDPDKPTVNASDLAFLKALYIAILKREADQPGLDFYLRALKNRTMTRQYIQAHFVDVCDQGLEPCGKTNTPVESAESVQVRRLYYEILKRALTRRDCSTLFSKFSQAA